MLMMYVFGHKKKKKKHRLVILFDGDDASHVVLLFLGRYMHKGYTEKRLR